MSQSSCPVGMNLSDGSYLLGKSRKSGGCLIEDEPSGCSCPIRMNLKVCLEVDACVIILEWRLLFSEHTDESLRVEGAFSHGAETDSDLIRDEPG